MRTQILRSIVGIGLLVVAGSANAQTCLGAAPFSTGALQLGGSISFADGAKSYTGGLSVGTTAGLFGGVALTQVDVDDDTESPKAVGASIGYQLPIGAAKKAQFCPLVAATKQLAIDVDPVTISGRTLGVGGSFGAIASSSPTFDFVPFAGLLFASTKATIEGLGLKDSESESYGSVTLGAGFVLNKNLTIQPRVVFPVGLEESDPNYGVAVAFNFGRVMQSARRAR